MGKPIAITRLDLSAAEVREQAAKTHDGAVVRRLLGIALVLEAIRGKRQPPRPAWTGKRCATGSIATMRAA